MASHLTLAVAQAHTRASTALTLAALARTARTAAEAGVDLLLFPEAYLGGYPRGTNFGCSIGARTDAGREQFLRYFQDAIDLGDTPGGAGAAWVRRRIGLLNEAGEEHADAASASASAGQRRRRGDGTREELERVARDTGVFLVTGVIERAGGSLYCAVVYVDPLRGCIGKRRKVMPTGTERLVWAQGSPSTLRAVQATIKGVEITLAAAICWENYMPLLRASLYSQGVNIYLAPTADGRDTWLPLMRTIAQEGRTFVLSANQCIRNEDLPGWISTGSESTSATNNQQAHHGADDLDGGGAYSPRSKSSGASTEISQSPRSARRVSNVTRTIENHEITWPSSEPKQADSLARTTSMTVSEGPHEICLPALNAARTAPEFPKRQQQLLEEGGETDAAVHGAALNKTRSQLGLASRGGSCIVGPDGAVLAGPLWDDTDGLLMINVDLEDCVRGRLDFDVAGHYSRNDSFELRVRGLDLNPP